MGLLGITKEVLTCSKSSASATYQRNRLVTITKSTNVAAYATYGSVADGYTRYTGVTADNEKVAVHPFSKTETFFLNALAAITKGNKVFPATDGRIVQSSYNCLAGITAAPSAPSEGDTYLLPAVPTGSGWSDHGNAVAIRGASSWSYVDVDATTNLGLTVYLTEERRYYTWNGTAWVVAKAAAIAGENAVAGQDIICYNVSEAYKLDVDSLPAGINWGPTLCKAVSGAGGAAAASILDNRVLTTDKLMFTPTSTTNACYVRSVACGSNGTVTVTFSADPGAWTGVLEVYR